MTNPNVLPQPADTEPSRHPEAGAAVVHFASQAETSVASAESAAEAATQPLPRRFTESWAVSGSHPSWLGFDSRSGEPKVG